MTRPYWPGERQVIADFGEIEQITPGFQAELGVAQGRRTGYAILAAVAL